MGSHSTRLDLLPIDRPVGLEKYRAPREIWHSRAGRPGASFLYHRNGMEVDLWFARCGDGEELPSRF